ncbi:xanthine dehydrogenase family protein molybdopterin-binding subunit [Sphingomonas gilva]|uniref:Xanthine dehydrogenase family protein molybdopterin-binding subunit n=1 Tax=Sphingomonas gilva TaxID=2305907 RepID=A0A396RMH2_9SPHN|nr:molybdopterin cofactor-binding domain-containing protein [Sphingomonas gilva]RHW17627.1 xanthine dehydrogenase family protein molybdopterin-binding subunit [Sphingomonas gilva]
MARERDEWTERRGISRRGLLIGGGAGIGLLVAFALWPRAHVANLRAAEGEHILGPWVKIGEDGHVAVIVPQAEMGQGVTTTLPQILADELGADWRTIAVEPAPPNPLYANRAAPMTLFEGSLGLPDDWADDFATRAGLTVTDGVHAEAAYEAPLRQAGAAARAMLCMAAAKRWDIDWQACDTEDGLVRWGEETLRFGGLAAEAAAETPPDPLPIRGFRRGGLIGQSVPRIDLPAKVDGSANFAGDIRLPNMVYAAIRQGPLGDSRLTRIDRAAADGIVGVLHVVENPRWVAAVATNWWAANRALDGMAPRFETGGGLIDDTHIETGLRTALAGEGARMVERGDLSAAFTGARIYTSDYYAAPALHAAAEPMTATAEWKTGRLELWLPTQTPAAARHAAAEAIGVAEAQVTVHPMLVGGQDGSKLDLEIARQAAVLAYALKRPVQLGWSRVEDLLRVPPRAPAAARLSARLAPNGMIEGWLAKIAAPATGRALASRLVPDHPEIAALTGWRAGDPYAVAGAAPPYAIPHMAIDHHRADLRLPTGHMRGGSHGANAFFTECFIDELSREAGVEPLSFRIAMLSGQARLARCLSIAATLGGWDGGSAGSGQGIAAHAMHGSYIAVMAEAAVDRSQRVRVSRLVAVVDCGRQNHPEIARQQIEGGLLFGVAQAVGAGASYTDNLGQARSLREVGIPALADAPEIVLQIVPSSVAPGAVGDIGVPAVAPAIANALRAASGTRYRSLPLRSA